MLDYHLHLWPHDRADVSLRLDQVARYCEAAQAAGVVEIALTEHLFRFVQAKERFGRFWDDEGTSDALRASMVEYYDFHARTDHSSIDNASSRSSNRQASIQCTDPSSTSKG